MLDPSALISNPRQSQKLLQPQASRTYTSYCSLHQTLFLPLPWEISHLKKILVLPNPNIGELGRHITLIDLRAKPIRHDLVICILPALQLAGATQQGPVALARGGSSAKPKRISGANSQNTSTISNAAELSQRFHINIQLFVQ